MGRTKGATNKEKPLAELTLSEEERLNILAELVLEIVVAEQADSLEEVLCLPN